MSPLILLIGMGVIAVLGGQAAVAAVGTISDGQKRYLYWYRWDSDFKAAAGRYAVDWRWLKATAIVESSLGQNPRVLAGGVSEDGLSYGLMQFTLPTAGDMAPLTVDGIKYTSIGISEINNAKLSIEMAAKYLSQLKRRFPDDLRKTIISYNQGPGNTSAGKDFTGDYWTKWSGALELINKG